MAVDYRLLDVSDAQQAAQLRIALLREVTDTVYSEDYPQKITRAIVRNLTDGSSIAMSAYDDDKMIATAMLCRYRTLPDEVEETGQGALLCNVYTVPTYRGRGIMEELLRRLIQRAQAAGIREIILSAEDKAMGLYSRLGFAPMPGAMGIFLE